MLLPCPEMAAPLRCSGDGGLLGFLDLVAGLFGVGLYSGEWSGLAETWVENAAAMSNGNRSSHAENIVGLRLPGGAMEKKSPELSL